MTILVTGAPGNVGSEVVRQLIAAGADFCIGAYDVEAARREFGEGVRVQRFDFLDESTFEFEGINKLFLVRPPNLANVPKEIAPAIHAAIAAGVEHIVFLSLQGVENNRVTPHYKIEQLIEELGVDYTFLRASFFMQNLSTTHRAEIRDEGKIAVPVGDAKTSFIDVRDIAAVAAAALTEPSHANQKYTLTGPEALTYDEVANILMRTLDHPVEYTHPSAPGFFIRQLRRGTKFGYAVVVTLLYTITRMGNANEVTHDVEDILHREPIRFEQFAQDYQQVWMVPHS
jgi:uncharacterized protein YbjT (DUF2867 family)